MENFQLYRTNLLLGGQMKWDLIVDSDDNGMYIKDFNLTPISNNIPYTYQDNKNILNNKHRENVKAFFKKNKGYFYNEGLDEMFNSNWPTIVKKDEIIQNYSNIYDMGCKRAKNYRKYGKQFEFFCPVWIEKLENSLLFKVSVRDVGTKTLLANKSIDITSYIDNYTHKNHNKFVDYFKEHISYLKLNTGNDNVANINIDGQSYISGLNVEYGIKLTKNISNIVHNMTSRERPVMEIDNMIITSFSNNNIISNQLFNFNICFNIDDFMSPSTAFFVRGNPLNISIDVEIDGKTIEKRDFYCNYETINRDKFYDFTDELNEQEKTAFIKEYPNVFTELNALDYLHDNAYIDFIDKNKYCPKICHWALSDNKEYMFNLYKGFEGYGIIKINDIPTIVENKNQYGKTPNIYIKKYAEDINNIGWINYENMERWDQFYKYIVNTDKYKNVNSLYLNKQTFVNNLKYNYVPEDTYLLVAKVTNKLLSTIENTYINKLSKINNELHVMVKDRLVLLITSNLDNVTFNSLYVDLYNLNANEWEGNDIKSEHKSFLKDIFKMMNNIEKPKTILLKSGLKWEYINDLDKNAKEISYIKDSTAGYVFRYDGNIKPYFIEGTDILYYKDYVSDERKDLYTPSKLQKSQYIKYLHSNYEPIYPSINYCACKSITEYDRTNVPNVNTTEHNNPNNPVPILSKYEYSWFNNGISLFLLPEITFNYESEKNSDGTYKNVKELIRKFLQKYYNVKNDELLDFIISLYDNENDWEYTSHENVEDYLYTIKLILK
jgi:hypothetical protein